MSASCLGWKRRRAHVSARSNLSCRRDRYPAQRAKAVGYRPPPARADQRRTRVGGLDAGAGPEEHADPREVLRLKKHRAVARIEQALNAREGQLARKHPSALARIYRGLLAKNDRARHDDAPVVARANAPTAHPHACGVDDASRRHSSSGLLPSTSLPVTLSERYPVIPGERRRAPHLTTRDRKR